MPAKTPLRVALLLAATVWAGPALAQTAPPSASRPASAAQSTPEAALACVAARYQGEALAVQWLVREQLWEVRWLTPARAVLRIKLAPGCRFDEVHGVGQEAALKPVSTPAGGTR